MKSCMSKVNFNIKKLNDISRVKLILVLLVVIMALTFSIPSLARYKNYINLEAMFNEVETWDGSVATGFNDGTGTEEDPYIISNASEFAYFASSIDDTGYAGYYFKLSNHIVLNNGTFGYDGTNRTYTLNDTLFYLGMYNGNVYDNANLSGNIISTINVFDKISNFKGYFDGDYHTIYGLYLTEDTSELALFNNLSGTVENVYFKNSLVYGGSSSAILANNVNYGEVNNVSVDGIVVGTGSTLTQTLDVSLEGFTVNKGFFSTFSRNVSIPNYIGYQFDSVVFSGNYAFSNGTQALTINNQSVNPGDFQINLNAGSTQVPLSMSNRWTSGDITLSNLNVTYTYNYPVSSGLVAIANDSNFTNVINKADVYGINVGGLFGIASDLSLLNSYNTGSLKGTNVSGLVSNVVNNDSTVIDNAYNSGNLNGTNTNLIGNVANNNSLVVNDTFNAVSASSTFGNVSGTVSPVNTYDINNTSVLSGTLEDSVDIVTNNEINKTLLVETLGYSEFVDNTYLIDNPDNVWVYEYEDYPIIYIDELNNPIASLNIGVNSWNDLGYSLRTIKYIENKAFNVTPLNGFNNFKEIYYYVYPGETPLNRSDIESITEWITYDDIVSLDLEGKYIVYIKIVDQDNYNYYINSDVLLFDLYGPDIKLSLGDTSWDSYSLALDNNYIEQETSLSIEVSDKYSEVDSTQYYVSNIFVAKDNLGTVEWNDDIENIRVTNRGPNVVYVKSIDSNGHESIINSGYITYGGFKEELSIGEYFNTSVDNAHINDRSSVTYKFSYDYDIAYTDGYNSKLLFSNKLPKGTIMTLIDHKLNEVYTYTVEDDSEDVIDLNKFNLVGTSSEVLFDDLTYLATNSKDISLVIDFNHARVDNDFNFNINLELRDSLDNVVMSTKGDSLKNTYVYNGLNSELSITNNSIIYGINYDSNSTNVINFKYGFESLINNDVVVNDTYYSNMKTGIIVKLVDSEGNIVDKKYLKNMEFIVNNTNYFADSDGIVRINLGSDLSDVTSSLTVVTYENDYDLTDGDYSLLIVPFVSPDGKYSDTYANSNISIPVVSDYEEILDYEFNVEMDNTSKILVKDEKIATIPFEILSNNEFKNANVRISLYKKKNLTAYDQNYELIDLDDYSSTELELVSNYSYKVVGSKLDLNLDLSIMDKTGYEIRFELFDGDKRIDLIKKKFIVK